MKSILIKSTGVILILIFLFSTLVGCVNDKNMIYCLGAYYEPDEWRKPDIPCAKIESDKTTFDIDSVTLDFYYALYSRKKGESLEELKSKYSYTISENNNFYHAEAEYAIYISNSEDLIFEKNDDNTLVDYKNKVNGIMWKFISFEEAFGSDYGYTTTMEKIYFLEFERVNYPRKETITIPKELFNSSNEYIYIHVITLHHNIENDQYSRDSLYCYTFGVKYEILWDAVKLNLAKTE